MSWQPRNTASSAQPKVTRSVNYYLSSMMRRWSPHHHRAMRLTDHHVVGTRRQLKPNTSPLHLTVKAKIKQLGDIPMTSGRAWTVEQVRTDRSTDHGDAPRHATTAIWPDATIILTPGPRAADGLHPSYVATWPDIEAPHTPFASLTR